jgi:hypothetical protein
MDLGIIAGVGGILTVVGILVELGRRTALVPDRWTPLASVALGAVFGPIYFYIGWLGVPPTPTPNGQWVAAAVIGILAGAASDGLTSAAKPLAAQPSPPAPPPA